MKGRMGGGVRGCTERSGSVRGLALCMSGAEPRVAPLGARSSRTRNGECGHLSQRWDGNGVRTESGSSKEIFIMMV